MCSGLQATTQLICTLLERVICSSVSVSTRQKVSRSHPSSKFPAKSNSRHNVARQFDINGVNSGGGAWAVRTLQTTTLSQHPEVVTLHSRCDGWLSHVQPQSTRGRQFDIRQEIWIDHRRTLLVEEQAVRDAAPICLRPLWPWPLTFDLESGVRVTCDVGYLCAKFSLARPLCSRLRPDVRDRQTSSDAHHRLMPPPPYNAKLLIYTFQPTGSGSSWGRRWWNWSACLRPSVTHSVQDSPSLHYTTVGILGINVDFTEFLKC